MLSRFLVAIGGLLFGVLIVVLVELSLAVLGVGEDAPLHDPFAGFSSAVAMFERGASPDGGESVYRISPARKGPPTLLGPEPQREFLAEKPDDQYRIFVVGGSSAQGVPYSTSYAFSAWLQRRLDAAIPESKVKIVNAGMAGYASRRIVPIVREIARYQPDLLVVYMGHNEWAETMYYEHLIKMDPRLFRLLESAYGTRIYALASQLLDLNISQTAPQLDIEADKNAAQMFGVLRDRAAGTKYPTARELAFRDILYEHNLRSMAREMKQVGAGLVFLTLSQNFSDWPPPASLHRSGLSEDERHRWESLKGSGSSLAEEGDCEAALDFYAEALEIDDEFAELHFEIANCQRTLGRSAEALEHYRNASDLDRVPHGASTRFNDVIRQVAKKEGAILVDVDAALVGESGDGLVGDDLFLDFAHPNIRAHQRIAATVEQAMRAAGVPVDSARWKDGYIDPSPSEIYDEEPQLAFLELRNSVLVCLLVQHADCADKATRLRALDPNNGFANRVLAILAARRDP